MKPLFFGPSLVALRWSATHCGGVVAKVACGKAVCGGAEAAVQAYVVVQKLLYKLSVASSVT